MRGLLQFTLDLFDGALGGTLAAPAAARQPASEVTTAPSPVPVLTPPANVTVSNAFRHPRATREVRLKDASVAYEFMRGTRRTIGFMVGPEGLSVRAPRWVALKDVDTALQEKADWILRKLDEIRNRHDRSEASRIVWTDGAQFPFLGEPVVVRVSGLRPTSGAAAAVLETTPDGDGMARQTLRLSLAHDASEDQVRAAVQVWITRQARRLFIERLDHFAPQLDVRWSKLSLSNAATRWGSASTSGSIRLNWRLVHFRLPVIDYVVAHELSHLRVMNHSQRFWDTVATVMPDYPALRRQLKDQPIPRW